MVDATVVKAHIGHPRASSLRRSGADSFPVDILLQVPGFTALSSTSTAAVVSCRLALPQPNPVAFPNLISVESAHQKQVAP